MASITEDEAEGPAAWTPPHATINVTTTLWVLTLFYVLSFIDRQIINILAEPIGKELHLSDKQIGFMAGLAFAAFYTILGMPLARYADNPKNNRVWLMSAAMALWSAMTAICGLAGNFLQLVLARMGVAVGEAGCTPAAHSMIADLYPPSKRSAAMAVYGLGQPVGGLFGMVIGGLLVDALGWRSAFMVVGLPGVLAAFLALAVLKDPRRTAAPPAHAQAPRVTLTQTLAEIVRSRAFMWILAGGTVMAFLGYGLGLWTAIFFQRSFHLKPHQVGLFLGGTQGVAGIVGTLLGGKLADWFGNRNPRQYLWTSMAGFAIAIPIQLLAYNQTDWRIAMAMLVIPNICHALHYGPAWGLVQGVVRPQTRAMASAVKLFVQALIGIGMGPLLFGIASDILKAHYGQESVRMVLYGAALSLLIPIFCYWRAGPALERELRRG